MSMVDTDKDRIKWLQRDVESLRSILASYPRSVKDITVERARQPELGWTEDHDDEHGYGHLIRLAKDRLERAYSLGDSGSTADDEAAREQLVKAAALIVAGIDLIDRDWRAGEAEEA